MTATGAPPEGTLFGRETAIRLAELAQHSLLGSRLEALRGRCVLLAVRDQLTAALALLELDGVARRLVLCPPDLAAEHLPHVVGTAGAEGWVGDASRPPAGCAAELSVTVRGAALSERIHARRYSHATEWVLLTSGTSGVPKLVLHTLATLSSALTRRPAARGSALWSTFYDIRRYGGLQIFLRAMHIGSLVLSAADEPVTDFLARARSAGVTHISGTPSHWRRMLMSGAAALLSPRYVRLSGEIADQAVLDSLRAAYPQAVVAHAFASTEAGVAFEVGDGQAGFPASLLQDSDTLIELRVADGTLQIRSPGNALRYLDAGAPPLRRPDGFVDTGDRVELRDGRYHFMGRAGGVINVGGLKVHPEEVEAVINSHPWVRMSLARARASPITGAVVTAEVVLAEPDGQRGERPSSETLTRELLERCKRTLPPHKVPAIIRIVPALKVSESGKLVRPNA
jgi:acyl-coenzyme A synthetase/AMP-(fatty) acid ligase